MFKTILYIVVTLSLLICTCNSQENAPESQPQTQEQSPQQPQEQPIEQQPQDSQNVEQPQTPQQPQDQQPQPQEQPQQQQEQPPQPQQQQPQEQPPQQPQQQQPSQQQQPQQSPQQQPPQQQPSPQQSPQQQQQSPQQSPQQPPQQPQQQPQQQRPPPSSNNNNNNNGVILGACTWPPAQIAMGQSLCFEAPANHCKILEGEVKRLLNTTVNMNLPIDSPFLWEANAICPDRGSCCNNVDVCIMSSPYLCLIYNYLLRNRSPVSFNPKSNCMDCIGVEFNTAVKTDINICTLQGAICDSQNQAVKIQINTSLEEFFRISLDQILRINATLTARALEVLGKVITEKNGILNVENITIRGEFDVQGGKVSVGSTASAENATVNMDSGEIRFNSLKLQNSLVSVNSHSIFLVDNNLDVSGGNFNVGDGAITVKGSLSLSNSKIKMNEFSDFMTMCNSDIKNSNFEFDFNDVVNSVLKGKKNGNSTKTIFNNKNYNNNKACDVRVSNTNVRISRNSLPIGCDSNKSSLNTINNNLVATLVITCDDSAIVVNYVLRFILTTRTKKTETEISTAISQGLSKGTNTNINSFTVIVTSNNTNNNTGFMWNIRIIFTGSGYEQFALAKKFSDLISSFSTTSSPPPPTSSSPSSSPPSSSFSSSSSSSSSGSSSGSVSGSSSASSAYYYAIQSLDATVDYTSMSMEENESKPKQPIDLLGVIIGCVVAALIVMVACAVFAQYSYRKGIAKAESNLISKSLKMNSSGGPKVY